MTAVNSQPRTHMATAERRGARIAACVGLCAVVPIYAVVVDRLTASGWLVRSANASIVRRAVLCSSVGLAAALIALVLTRSARSVPRAVAGRLRRLGGAIAVGCGWGWVGLGEMDHHVLRTFDFSRYHHPTLVEAAFHVVGMAVGAVGWHLATVAAPPARHRRTVEPPPARVPTAVESIR